MNIFKNNGFLFVLLIYATQMCPQVFAQTNGHITLSYEDLKPNPSQGTYEGLPLYYNWRYHAGDNVDWADPSFDDSRWEQAPDTRLFPKAMPQSGWSGMGWFRLHVSVDSNLRDRALSLRIYNPGALEIYLDGKLITRLGTVGFSQADEIARWDNVPKVLHLNANQDHLLAVRYSGHGIKSEQHLGIPIGFALIVGGLSGAIESKIAYTQRITSYQMFFSGVPIAVALVHFFIFAFYPRTKENLYFSLFAAGFAAYVFINFQGHALTDATLYPAIMHLGRVSQDIVWLVKLWMTAVVVMGVSGIRFLYCIFYAQLPRQFFIFLFTGVILGLWSWVSPFQLWPVFNLFGLLLVGEMVRVVLLALIHKKSGARIIGVGTASMFFGAIYLLLRNLGIEGIPFLSASFYFGFLILFFSMSVLLARNFTAIRQRLEQQLQTVHDLSLINEDLQQSRALEQVREQTAAMRQSQDIVSVVAKLWQGLVSCDLAFEALSIAVTEPGRRRLQFYAAAKIDADMVHLLPNPNKRLFASNVVPNVNLWRNDVPLSYALKLRPQPGLHTVDGPFYAYLNQIWGIEDPTAKLENRSIIEAAFDHGYMGLLAQRDHAFTPNQCQIVEQFVEALSLGYTRFFDLQKLEKQNRALEEANQEVQRANQAKSVFLANMSHEIRTPINAILGYAQILQRSHDLPDVHRSAIETIQSSGDHLLMLINDVLDLSKIEANRVALAPTHFDLSQLLSDLDVLFQVRCVSKGLDWQLVWDGLQPVWVYADEVKLKQVLINLLDNAVKFTEEGHVALQVTPSETPIEASVPPENMSYEFEVSDTGVGISEADQTHLFDIFQQGAAGEDHGGTGLGLAICKQHVELMGGQLNLVSTQGKGTCFSFVLSLPAGQENVQETNDWSRVRRLTNDCQVKAFVADDQEESRAILGQALEDIGVDVEMFQNGQEILQALALSVPDIVFLDIRMPVLNGLETLTEIKKQSEWDAIKTVAVSASTFGDERKQVEEIHFDAFIAKPYRFDTLYACLHDLLDVTFVYDTVSQTSSTLSREDLDKIVLPTDLYDRLQEATEFRRVTQLETCFQEVETLGFANLATHFRNLRRQHNMDAILTMLKDMSHD